MDIPQKGRYITTVFALRLLWDSIYDAWSKGCSDRGITITEEQVLWAIWLLDSSTVTGVASVLRRDKGTISKSIYSLEENGIVVREPGIDRRSYVFRLSTKGNELRKSLSVAHGSNSAFSEALTTLSEDEQHAFIETVLKLAHYIEGETYVHRIVNSLTKVVED